jgi:hypothetical protein
MAFVDSFKRDGVRGWAEAIGGGAAAGMALGGPLGAAIGAAAGLFSRLIKLAIGKSTGKAGDIEAERDLGLSLPSGTFKSFYESVGLDEKSAWNIRKDLEMSPKFLTEIALPEAQKHQGGVEALLEKLKNVTTAWGTFDFSTAMQKYLKTGAADDLNEAFKKAFSQSGALSASIKNMGDLFAADVAGAAHKYAMSWKLPGWHGGDYPEAATPPSTGTGGDVNIAVVNVYTDDPNSFVSKLKQIAELGYAPETP